MPISTVTLRNALAGAYANACTHGALYSTAPGVNAGTELTGGSPAYSRQPLTWSAPANSAVTASATFNVASGATVAGFGCHSASAPSGSPDTTFRDGSSLPAQPFVSQGSYAISVTYTQQ